MRDYIPEHIFVTLCFMGLMSYCWASYFINDLQWSVAYLGAIALGGILLLKVLSRRTRSIPVKYPFK